MNQFIDISPDGIPIRSAKRTRNGDTTPVRLPIDDRPAAVVLAFDEQAFRDWEVREGRNYSCITHATRPGQIVGLGDDHTVIIPLIGWHVNASPELMNEVNRLHHRIYPGTPF